MQSQLPLPTISPVPSSDVQIQFICLWRELLEGIKENIIPQHWGALIDPPGKPIIFLAVETFFFYCECETYMFVKKW